MADFDVVVLGAGPGGYVAAIRASQLGKKVAVVEKKYWGGVCLNVGCIPSKALLKNAEIAHLLTHDKAKYGIEGDATMSYAPTFKRSRQVSDGIVRGVHFLMKKNKVQEIDGWGTLTSSTSMDVALNDGSTRQLTFDHLIIAAGAVTRMLPGVTDLAERRHLRGADPRREPPRVDHHRRLGRDRRRVRLRHEELRRRRHDRRVPRPDGAHRGRRHLQGARQALQEARREGAARAPRSRAWRTPARACGSPSRRPPAATSRCSRPTSSSPPSGSRRAPRATASRPPGSRSPTGAPSRSTSTAAPTCRTSTPSATAPPS